MMKKISVKKIVLAFTATVLFAGCHIGLGPSVDVQAPVIEITSHKDNDAVPQSFTIRGTAYDNEDLALINIDFEDSDIHYQVEPGKNWFKKTSYTADWVEIPESKSNYCTLTGGKWLWSIDVDTADKISSKTGNSYNCTAICQDRIGNTGAKSKAQCTLIVDTESPDVSFVKPELFTGKYSDVVTKVQDYALQDGNVISRLLNGEIQISGRQANALAYKSFRLELDNGELQSGVSKSTASTSTPVNSIEDILNLSDAKLGDATEPVVYYSTTINDSDLRDWTVVIKPEDWAQNYGLNTGKHIIRVVTTSLSASNCWERKVLGYFVWYPEADAPWVSEVATDTEDKAVELKYECYPKSKISGSAQDDDGIATLVSQLKKYQNGKYENYSTPINHALPASTGSSKPTYAAWSVPVPAENGNYELTVTVTDIYNNSSHITRYFKTSDVSAPEISITSPVENSSIITSTAGKIKFNGSVADDGKIESVSMVWLNPALRTDPSNKIKYMTGLHDDWNIGTENGAKDANGNIVFLLYKSSADNIERSFTINKEIDLYNTLGIGGKDSKGQDILLSTQEFVFRASDGVSNSIKAVTLSGDSYTPELSFDKITIGSNTQSLAGSEPPTFPKIPAGGATATVTGKWSDKFNDTIVNKNKLYDLELVWDKNHASTTVKEDGTWTVNIAVPQAGGTITAKLKDFGGNTKTIQAAASIETVDLGLSRIDCEEDDGAYMASVNPLHITLEFTKGTTCDTSKGTPTLSLSNGATATYASGSGSTTHVYTYTVKSTDADSDALYVTQINANGAKWYDSVVSGTPEDLTAGIVDKSLIIDSQRNPTTANLSATRTIKIDNKKPKIKSVMPLSSDGYYKENGTLLFMMEFTEDVSITNISNLAVKFSHLKAGNNVKTMESSASGSRFVLLTHKISSGENANPLMYSAIERTSVVVTDMAGNTLESWTPETTPDFTGIRIMTEKPSVPGFGSWNPDSVIFDPDGTEFTVSGSSGCSIEYSLDGGTNWLPYKSKVTLKNNGTYHVTARQTDAAGNVSDDAEVKDFIIDKGDLFTRITSSTVSGSYSTKTDVKKIEGKIEFRKSVTLPKGASVTLNVVRNNANVTVPVKECVSAANSSSVFTFDYIIVEGDSIPQNADLDVTALSFARVGIVDHDGIEVPVSVTDDKRLNANRSIKILTGKPSVVDSGIKFEGEDENTVLEITFDRPVAKVSGDIIFEYNITDSNAFHVPAVLTADEYNELCSVNEIKSVISSSYSKGVNGADVVNQTTKALQNNTETKYVLNFSINDTNEDLKNAFITAGKHQVRIPVISDQVSVVAAGGSRVITEGTVLRVVFGNAYRLPVKGAEYRITVPEGAVTDEVKNLNENISEVKTAAGIESPKIRLLKSAYTITRTTATTSGSNANMASAQSAKLRIDCRTPGASINYGLRINKSNAVTVSAANDVINTKTADVTVPDAINTSYTTDAQIEFADGDDYLVNAYGTASGLKVAIGATASKTISGVSYSKTSYERANRTVLKFKNTGNHYDGGNGGNTKVSNIQEGETRLKFGDLKLWVQGGDSPYGNNTADPFPLSWNDSANFKLMQMSANFSGTNMVCEGWWVSWDVTQATYHGFAIGDVPSEAETKGPTRWYVSECAWVATKDRYVLYPGETLVMVNQNGTNGSSFLFRLKNEGVSKYY